MYGIFFSLVKFWVIDNYGRRAERQFRGPQKGSAARVGVVAYFGHRGVRHGHHGVDRAGARQQVHAGHLQEEPRLVARRQQPQRRRRHRRAHDVRRQQPRESQQVVVGDVGAAPRVALGQPAETHVALGPQRPHGGAARRRESRRERVPAVDDPVRRQRVAEHRRVRVEEPVRGQASQVEQAVGQVLDVLGPVGRQARGEPAPRAVARLGARRPGPRLRIDGGLRQKRVVVRDRHAARLAHRGVARRTGDRRGAAPRRAGLRGRRRVREALAERRRPERPKAVPVLPHAAVQASRVVPEPLQAVLGVQRAVVGVREDRPRGGLVGQRSREDRSRHDLEVEAQPGDEVGDQLREPVEQPRERQAGGVAEHQLRVARDLLDAQRAQELGDVVAERRAAQHQVARQKPESRQVGAPPGGGQRLNRRRVRFLGVEAVRQRGRDDVEQVVALCRQHLPPYRLQVVRVPVRVVASHGQRSLVEQVRLGQAAALAQQHVA
ncbi:ORF070 [Saltwater crocodilepox virus]|nr:ORF070 [Saltwater crocodilepox virus]